MVGVGETKTVEWSCIAPFIHSFVHSFIPSFLPSFLPYLLPSFLPSSIITANSTKGGPDVRDDCNIVTHLTVYNSLRLALSVMRRQCFMRTFLRFGVAGLYVVTKGKRFLDVLGLI